MAIDADAHGAGQRPTREAGFAERCWRSAGWPRNTINGVPELLLEPALREVDLEVELLGFETGAEAAVAPAVAADLVHAVEPLQVTPRGGAALVRPVARLVMEPVVEREQQTRFRVRPAPGVELEQIGGADGNEVLREETKLVFECGGQPRGGTSW